MAAGVPARFFPTLVIDFRHELALRHGGPRESSNFPPVLTPTMRKPWPALRLTLAVRLHGHESKVLLPLKILRLARWLSRRPFGVRQGARHDGTNAPAAH
jgi:hypothetical protein